MRDWQWIEVADFIKSETSEGSCYRRQVTPAFGLVTRHVTGSAVDKEGAFSWWWDQSVKVSLMPTWRCHLQLMDGNAVHYGKKEASLRNEWTTKKPNKQAKEKIVDRLQRRSIGHHMPNLQSMIKCRHDGYGEHTTIEYFFSFRTEMRQVSRTYIVQTMTVFLYCLEWQMYFEDFYTTPQAMAFFQRIFQVSALPPWNLQNFQVSYRYN